jgi:hypothetical protein
MPRISDVFLQCAVYVYESREDAELGIHQGGSGFLTHLFLEQNKEWSEIYVVTNRHAIIDPKTMIMRDPVIRLNRKDGKIECFETKCRDWILHSDGDDIAVLPFRFRYSEMDYWSVPSDFFLTPEVVSREDVGIGDDTFMVGRFVNHEGREKNAPAVRFGNIAMMPKEKIASPYGIDQESFLVEVRSLPGYSGSAVFLHSANAINDMSIRRGGKEKPKLPDRSTANALEVLQESLDSMEPFMNPKGPYLLGIDWCHIPRKSLVRAVDGSPVDGNWYVDENTGMAGVIPAWKIIDVLNSEELIMQREIADQKITDKKQSSTASLDVADDPKSFTRDEFEAALKKASRKIPPQQS